MPSSTVSGTGSNVMDSTNPIRCTIRWRRGCQGQGWRRFSYSLHGLRWLPVRYSHILSVQQLNMDRFAEKVIKASKGEKGIVEPSFVYLPGVEGGAAIAKTTGTEFFSVPIELGVSLNRPY